MWYLLRLGFCICPEKGDKSWVNAARKYESRVMLWADASLGLQYDALVYNTFSITCLGYIAQLETPPAWLLQREEAMLRRAAKGPGKTWATKRDLWHLQEYGLVRAFTSIETLALAAQLRARTYDKACCDSKLFRKRVGELRNSIAAPTQLGAAKLWSSWFRTSFLLRLDDTEKYFTNNICSVKQLYLDIGKGRRQNNNTEDSKPSRKAGFQGAAYRRCLAHRAPDPVFRVRENLERWKLLDPSWHPHVTLAGKQRTPAWLGETTLRHLLLLRQLVPPRVVSAVFSTIWNRWTTERRFDRRQSPSNVCKLGCSCSAEDRIEHYARCPITLETSRRFLRLDPQCQVNLHTFVCCNPNVKTDADITAAALLVYAVYRATNYQRFQTPLTNPSDIIDAMKQWTREGARGHPAAMRVLDTRWSDKHNPDLAGGGTRRVRARHA